MKVRKAKVSDQLALIAKKMGNTVSTMEENLETTKYVRSNIPSYNRAIILGGAPLGCVYAVHGPYGGGKSTFCALLLDSFVRQGHVGLYIDAEHTVTKKWFVQLGLDPSTFFFKRPTFMEEVTDEIDNMIYSFDELKRAGDYDEDKALIIFVDTVNKLTPAKEYEQYKKLGAEAMEKGLSRYRGLMLQTWLDHMTPIVGSRDVALVCIAQERIKKDAKPWEDDISVKGCQGLMFDAAVRFRIRGSKLWEDVNKKKVLVGQKHTIYVFKNKVGFPYEQGEFYISNGKGSSPIGYNRAKTAFEEAKKRDGIIELRGKNNYEYGIHKWHGEKQAIAALESDKDLLDCLCKELDEQVVKQEVAPSPQPLVKSDIAIPEDDEEIIETLENDEEEENVGHDESPLAR